MRPTRTTVIKCQNPFRKQNRRRALPHLTPSLLGRGSREWYQNKRSEQRGYRKST